MLLKVLIPKIVNGKVVEASLLPTPPAIGDIVISDIGAILLKEKEGMLLLCDISKVFWNTQIDPIEPWKVIMKLEPIAKGLLYRIIKNVWIDKVATIAYDNEYRND